MTKTGTLMFAIEAVYPHGSDHPSPGRIIVLDGHDNMVGTFHHEELSAILLRHRDMAETYQAFYDGKPNRDD